MTFTEVLELVLDNGGTVMRNGVHFKVDNFGCLTAVGDGSPIRSIDWFMATDWAWSMKPSCDHILMEQIREDFISGLAPENKEHGLRDTGAREFMDTGMMREPRTGKGRFDLISPIALRRLAIHYENGATKYAERNWELGGKLHRYLCSSIGHLQDYLEGDRSEDHLSASSWNNFCIVHTEEMIKRGLLSPELNKLPNYTGKGIKTDG